MKLCGKKTKKGTKCKNSCNCKLHSKRTGGGRREPSQKGYDDFIREHKLYDAKMRVIESQGRSFLKRAQNFIPTEVKIPPKVSYPFNVHPVKK